MSQNILNIGVWPWGPRIAPTRKSSHIVLSQIGLSPCSGEPCGSLPGPFKNQSFLHHHHFFVLIGQCLAYPVPVHFSLPPCPWNTSLPTPVSLHRMPEGPLSRLTIDPLPKLCCQNEDRTSQKMVCILVPLTPVHVVH